MQKLKDYILNESLIFENVKGEIITEGFWKNLGSIFGFNTEKVAKTMSNWSDDLKKGFTVGQYIAAKSKDKEVKKSAEEEAQATEKSPEERLKQLHKVANKYSNYDLSDYENDENALGFIYYVYRNLDLLADSLNKLNEKKSAEKLKERMEKYKVFDKAQKIYEKQYLPKIEKAGVDGGPKGESNEKENTDQPKSDEKADLGGGDKENPNGKAVSSEQQKNAINNDIKENVDFFKQLAQESGLKGEDISGMIQGLINTSFKEQDKDGNWKWKIKNAHGIFGTEEQEQKFVKGLGAILCGAVIINHSAMTEAIHSVLEKLGFKKANIINKLKEIAKK